MARFFSKGRFIFALVLVVLGVLLIFEGRALAPYFFRDVVVYVVPGRYDSNWEQSFVNGVCFPLGFIAVFAGLIMLISAESMHTEPQKPVETNTEHGKLNTETIRELLVVAFDDEALTTLCFDHYRPVHDGFGSGMSKSEKAQQLLDYCIRQGKLDRLLALVEERNPHQYANYQDRIPRE